MMRKRSERPWEDESSREHVENSNSGDDPFDCGIDWDEAERVLVATSSSVSASNVQILPSPGNPTALSRQHMPLQGQQQQSASVTSSNTMLDDARCSVVADPSNRTGSENAFCQKNNASNSSAVTSGLLSSIRPETWVKSMSVPPARLPVADHQAYHDPRQDTLPPQLRFDPETVKPVQDSYLSQLVAHANLSAPLLNGWKLYPHQKRAILCGIKMRRMILALDMGLGKTLIGCVWAKAFCSTIPSIKVLVICPVSLTEEWRRTAVEATGLTVSSKPASWLETSGEDEEDEHQVFVTSWAKVPTKINVVQEYIVVADEAHAIQNAESARTKAALSLMLADGCIGVLLLTGTPMKNGKPSNLFPLLKAVRHPLGRHQRAYEIHFCAGREMNYGTSKPVWNASGSANVDQLRALCQSHLLHLTKEDCLKDLPPQTRVMHHVPVSSRWQLKHDYALQDLAKIYQSNGSSGNSGEAILGAIQRLRMVGSLAKMDAAVQMARQVLEKEAAVVVFTNFVEVAKTVHKLLGESGWQGELLTGETAPKKRQAMVDRFQAGLAPIFVCTFGAGGVGLTLTAAHTIILIDRPWTPGEVHQAEDRVRRIGQTKPVRSIWMSSFSIDEQIDRLVHEKSKVSNSVLSLTSGESNESRVQQSIIPMILKAVLTSDVLQQQKIKTSGR